VSNSPNCLLSCRLSIFLHGSLLPILQKTLPVLQLSLNTLEIRVPVQFAVYQVSPFCSPFPSLFIDIDSCLFDERPAQESLKYPSEQSLFILNDSEYDLLFCCPFSRFRDIRPFFPPQALSFSLLPEFPNGRFQML